MLITFSMVYKRHQNNMNILPEKLVLAKPFLNDFTNFILLTAIKNVIVAICDKILTSLHSFYRISMLKCHS